MKHDLKSSLTSISHVTEYLCFNCDTERRKQGFPSTLALIEHLKFKHEPPEKQVIRNMQKRHRINVYNLNDPGIEHLDHLKEPTFLPPPQKLITGIKNTSGQVSMNLKVGKIVPIRKNHQFPFFENLGRLQSFWKS